MASGRWSRFWRTYKPILSSNRCYATIAVPSTAVLTFALRSAYHDVYFMDTPKAPGKQLPTYTKAQVAQHKTKESRIWVTYKDGVYDVTDFVKVHPGGDKIMLAAGAAADPFWVIYNAHNTPHTRELLERYRIGNLAAADVAAGAAAIASAADPYASDPPRSPLLAMRSEKPCNAEPPAALLADSYITREEVMFVRNHLPVPIVAEAEYALKVAGEGLGGRTLRLSLADLKDAARFPPVTVTVALECAGNRRAAMNAGYDGAKPTRGLTWGPGAIANVEFKGARLLDVLEAAGLDVSQRTAAAARVKHIQFEGLDRDPATGTAYSASVPADVALDPRRDAVLAYEMNGKPLTRDHGYPVRTIVPGTVAARQVKWLSKITTSAEEADSIWQKKDYKVFPPSMDWDTVDFDSMPAMQDMPVQSAICEPSEGATLPAGSTEVTMKGFAWSGSGRGITRVDVSADAGATWHTASIVAQPPDSTPSRTRSWGWTLWRADVPLPAASASAAHAGQPITLVCKAIDTACSTQPESPRPIWNFRGLANNAWHKVNVSVEPDSEED